MKLISYLLIFSIVLLDVISKIFVKNNFSSEALSLNNYIIIQKTFNKGIAFSLFNYESQITNIIFIIIIFIIILFIINYVAKNDLAKTQFFAWTFVIGGAIGNLLDRIVNGKVLDFIIIHIENIYFPAIFNFADIFISFGILLIILNSLIYSND